MYIDVCSLDVVRKPESRSESSVKTLLKAHEFSATEGSRSTPQWDDAANHTERKRELAKAKVQSTNSLAL